MRLSVIIVSWQVRDLLRTCLRSLEKNQGCDDYEVIVVDNNSADDSLEMVKKEFPLVKVIANQDNLGFAKANNQAWATTQGDYILLLNPDTELASDCLRQALDFLDQHQEYAVLGGQLLNPDGTIQPSVRNLPTWWPIILLLLKAPKIFKHLPALDRYLAKDFDYDRLQTAEQIMGAFMLIRRSLIERIGLFDERFFIWFEEVDFCRRTRDAGEKICYYPKAKLIHYGGQSFAQKNTLRKQWHFFISAAKYFIKYGFKP